MNGAPTPADVDAAVRARTAAGIRLDGQPSLPPDVNLSDGLTQEEAVAVALWNSPSFQATLADLGVARADLAEAGLLRNPIFSLLFPFGPKQLEFTLQYPFEACGSARRVAAARLNAQAIGERLVWDALSLVAQVRTAHADAVIADRRVTLATRMQTWPAGSPTSSMRAFEPAISASWKHARREPMPRAPTSCGAQRSTTATLPVSRWPRCWVSTGPRTAAAAPSAAYDSPPCPVDDARFKDALAARPDVRAAELSIEAAAARARWERSRVVSLIGILDANGRGTEGFEMGPGIGTELPFFTRNQGGIARATVEIERASHLYAAARAQVIADVRSAGEREAQAQQALDAWSVEIVPSLETEQRQADSAYRAGEIPLFNVLDVSRRLIDGRMRQLDAEADLSRARISLERAIGRYCR